MRLLLIHADRFKYEVTGKTSISDKSKELDAADKKKEIGESLVAFISVEEQDGENVDGVAQDAANSILEQAKKINAPSIMVYPYAHLSSSLAAPRVSQKVIDSVIANLKKSEVTIYNSVFGYYKSFSIDCKGHPLSELAKTINPAKKREELSSALKAEKETKSTWMILNEGQMVNASEYNFSDISNLNKFYNYEQSGSRVSDEEPPHIKIMKEHCLVDYEKGSDSGNFRWYPNGFLIKRLLEEHVSNILGRYGAMQVETPIMYDADHPKLARYIDRFPARQYIIKSDNREFFLRFAACFGQYLMKHDMNISYKNLPLRLYELTHYSFRREQSGELSGLKRLRAFTMPDMHTLTADIDQAKEEFLNQFMLCKEWMRDVDLEYEMALRVVSDFYEPNKDFFNELGRRMGVPVLVEMWNKRFFYYVTKFEFNIIDNQDKASALSTVQIDIENAESFDISYVTKDGQKARPLILHASISGGIDRVLYAILEKEAKKIREGKKGSLPLWLSPTQVRLIPVSDRFMPNILSIFDRIKYRVDIDDRDSSMGSKIRDAEREWIPYIAIIGEKEIESGNLSVRIRNEGTKEMTIDALNSDISEKTSQKPFRALNLPAKLSKRPIFA